jgi:hypothetical protein
MSTPRARQAEQQVQADGHADHFGQVAGRDRDLGQDVERDVDHSRVGVPRGLRQVEAAHDAQAAAEALQQQRHQVAHQQHPDELVAEGAAAGDVGGPVARVHVADADQVGGPDEGEHAPPAFRCGNSHTGMRVAKRAPVVRHGFRLFFVGRISTNR